MSFSTLINANNLAQAAFKIFEEENLEKDLVLFESTDDSKTYRSLHNHECFWKKVCKVILSQRTRNPHKQTMRKYVKRCYDLLRRPNSFALVEKKFNELRDSQKSPMRKVSPKSKNIKRRVRSRRRGFESRTEDQEFVENKSPSLNDLKPWGTADCSGIGAEWKNQLPFTWSGVVLHKESLESLLPGRDIDDNIVTIFSKKIVSSTNCDEFCIFDPHFMASLLSNTNEFQGFFAWASKNEVCKSRLWLIPYNPGRHWVLIIVAFGMKTFFVIDSLNSSFPKKPIYKICDFIDHLFEFEKKEISWESWKIESPQNILRQADFVSCGIHMLGWIYIISHQADLEFENREIDIMRRWIFYSILELKGSDDLRELSKSNRDKLLKSWTKGKSKNRRFAILQSSTMWGGVGRHITESRSTKFLYHICITHGLIEKTERNSILPNTCGKWLYLRE